MSEYENIAEDLLKFQISRNTSKIAKNILIMLENYSFNNGGAISDVNFQRLRKIVLDTCNDSKRELDTLVDKLDINFKFNN